MADDTNSAEEKPSELPPRIEFLDNHLPPLPNGQYELRVSQTIGVAPPGNLPPFAAAALAETNPSETFTAAVRFFVAGERFVLNPTEVRSVFPPDGSLGPHAMVLPHVVLNRSTLPWERTSLDDSASEDESRRTPWLALLLFDESEKPEVRSVTVGDLLKPSKEPYSPGLAPEPGQKSEDRVSVIDVDADLLRTIAPTAEDLRLLAHVRQGVDEAGKLVGEELAVVIGNRLPASDGNNTVHLVSLEGRYEGSTIATGGAGKVRLVTLRSWSFACLDPLSSFEGLAMNLDGGTLRRPESGPKSEPYLERGFTPLRYRLRRGGRTYAWYHGPLVPGDTQYARTDDPDRVPLELPADMADSLLVFDEPSGWFDASYAAAWELGRLLTLQNRSVSLALFGWKQSVASGVRRFEDVMLAPHLAHLEFAEDMPEPPVAVLRWLDRLYLLQNIPFGYLVPDERMLPRESIRFFQIDPLWVDCLLDGAFGVGRTPASASTTPKSPVVDLDQDRSGFLLRSALVSGWPDLQIEGEDEQGALPPPRVERLGPDALMAVFEGRVASVSLHVKPETLHFGFDVRKDANADGRFDVRDLTMILRDPETGVEYGGDRPGERIEIREPEVGVWRPLRVANVARLASVIGTTLKGAGKLSKAELTAAQFALQLTEGTTIQEIRRADFVSPRDRGK